MKGIAPWRKLLKADRRAHFQTNILNISIIVLKVVTVIIESQDLFLIISITK
jgi:hypothetical protein